MESNSIHLRSYQTESCSHTHSFAQLVLPVSGTMEIEVSYYSGIINHDIGVYIAPNEQHCFAGSKKNLFLVIDMNAKINSQIEVFQSNLLNLTMSTKKFIQFAYYYLENNERDIYTDSLINQLLFHFSTSSILSSPDPVVMKAKQWIDCYFPYSIDVSKVAAHCYLSVSQLQRRFKLVFGYGVAEYWRMKKLHHAKRFLMQKKCSIEAIAVEVGYENLPAFSRRFSKVFGESPSQWRAKMLTANKMREIDNKMSD